MMMMKEEQKEEKEKEGIEYITLTECNLPQKYYLALHRKSLKIQLYTHLRKPKR